MKDHFASLAVLLFLFFKFFSGHASACERVTQLSPVFATAAADAVVLVHVDKVVGLSHVKAHVLKSYKGPLAGDFEFRGAMTEKPSSKYPCRIAPVEAGGEYLLYLQKGSNWQVVDALDGVKDPQFVTGIEQVVARQGQHSLPNVIEEKLEAQLIVAQKVFQQREEIQLVLFLRNLSSEPLKLKYSTWPPKEHTYCQLKINETRRGVIEPAAVPILKADINDYFSKHGQKYEITINPSDTHTVSLERISTAKTGWGYKEQLGFKYYPMPPGKYQISAECLGFFVQPIVTNNVQVQVVK